MKATAQQLTKARCIADVVFTALDVPVELISASGKMSNAVVDARFVAVLLIKDFVPSLCNAHIATVMHRARCTIHSTREMAANYLETSEDFQLKYATAKNAVQQWLRQQSK